MSQELSTNIEVSDEFNAYSAEQHEAEPILEPRIWVASLTDHEHGVPHGAWISAEQDLRGIRADLDAMLASSPTATRTGKAVRDWAIFYAVDFGLWPIRPHSGLQRISNIGLGIAEHGAAFAAWASITADDEQLSEFDTAYQGHYDDLHTYLEQLINDLGYNQIVDQAVPVQLRPWVKIDIPATATDLLNGGDLQVIKAPHGGVWIFHG